MAINLRSGSKVESNGEKKEEKTVKNGGSADPNQFNSRTTIVVFIGLLLDLLAFTLILPLFPALLDHYKKHDSETGLYPYLVTFINVSKSLTLGFYLFYSLIHL
jgi:hypothetical protein